MGGEVGDLPDAETRARPPPASRGRTCSRNRAAAPTRGSSCFRYSAVTASRTACGSEIGRLLQDRGECRPGVLGVEVELPGDEGLVADERAAEVQPPVHADARALPDPARRSRPGSPARRSSSIRSGPDSRPLRLQPEAPRARRTPSHASRFIARASVRRAPRPASARKREERGRHGAGEDQPVVHDRDARGR